MRAVIQRVSKAHVDVKGKQVGSIGSGMLILLGIHRDDEPSDADYLIRKIPQLRMFEDENEKMNHSLITSQGEALVISQFTLYANCLKGRRPSFDQAASSNIAEDLYKYFVEGLKNQNIPVQTGIFGAMMEIGLINDGPFTLVIDSP